MCQWLPYTYDIFRCYLYRHMYYGLHLYTYILEECITDISVLSTTDVWTTGEISGCIYRNINFRWQLNVLSSINAYIRDPISMCIYAKEMCIIPIFVWICYWYVHYRHILVCLLLTITNTQSIRVYKQTKQVKEDPQLLEWQHMLQECTDTPFFSRYLKSLHN